MPESLEDRFVQFIWPCACGIELQVHGEYFVGVRAGGHDFVTCPRCSKEHPLPTRPLRFFFRDENGWKVARM